MQKNRRIFEIRGPVSPDRNYVLPRTAAIADLVNRLAQILMEDMDISLDETIRPISVGTNDLRLS